MIFLTSTTPAAASASAFPSSAEEGSLSQHCSLNEEFLATDYADLADFNPFNPRNPFAAHKAARLAGESPAVRIGCALT